MRGLLQLQGFGAGVKHQQHVATVHGLAQHHVVGQHAAGYRAGHRMGGAHHLDTGLSAHFAHSHFGTQEPHQPGTHQQTAQQPYGPGAVAVVGVERAGGE